MTDIASSFEELLSGLPVSSSQEADLLLLQLEPALARRMRLCAIPHSFNASILSVLDPALDPIAVAATLEEFEKLPAVLPSPDGYVLHDVVRKQLFDQWLEKERYREFRQVSQRLAEYCMTRGDQSTEAEAKSQSFIYHLVGADLERGFEAFQFEYRRLREQARFGDCESLVQLVREYRAILGASERAWLAYYEAQIAIDRRDWNRAREALEQLLKNDVSTSLRARVLLTLGSVLRLPAISKLRGGAATSPYFSRKRSEDEV